MKILLVHNYYQQSGGEDTVFRAERDLLKKYGHNVIEYTDYNDRIKTMSPLSVARDTIWSTYSYKRIQKILKEEKPDIAHFHNIFPLISPSVYYACKKTRIPVVQTLHNYRLLCPVAIFYRDGHICEECIGKKFPSYMTLSDYKNRQISLSKNIPLFPYHAIFHRCYHSSAIHSALVAFYLLFHRILGTWKNEVNAYIALTEFAKNKFIEGGLPEKKIFVKPNFVSSNQELESEKNNYALFVGRLSKEKGIITLLKVWEHIKGLELKIVGEGPISEDLKSFVIKNNIRNVQFIGKLMKEDVIPLMKKALFLIFPSECYEGFPITIIESFSSGTAVIASKVGSIEEIIKDKFNGLHFTVNILEEFISKVEWAIRNKEAIASIGKNAQKIYLNNYSTEKNYDILLKIYNKLV